MLNSVSQAKPKSKNEQISFIRIERKMESSLQQILRKYYVDGVFHTHVSLIQPKGRYQFNRQGLEEFWDRYSDIITTDSNSILGIAEKPQHYSPILVDVDIKVKDEDDMEIGEKLYSEQQVKDVIQVYQSTLRKIVEDCTDEKLTCVLLEKDMYSINKNDITYIKHGFHLHFPYLFLSKVNQEVHLIPRVKDLLNEMKVFENLHITNSGDVIDNACCKVPWLLYGSRKNDSSQPYLVTKVYNSELDEISLEKAFKNYQLFDQKEKLIKIKHDVKKYLPRILSILPYGRPVSEVKPGTISPLKEKIKERKKTEGKTYNQQTISRQLEIAEKILPMLAEFRADDRNEWLTVGWALYNISDGSAEGLDLWCEFSSRCEDKYDEGTCIFEWERMVKKDITLGTLRYYASIDNPEEYSQFKQDEAEKYVKESLSGSHNDVAKALHAEFGDEFVCASISNKVWFQFVNHKWQVSEEGVDLRRKISDVIVDRFARAGKDLFGKLSTNEDKAEEQMINARIKQVQKMVSSLKSAPYKNNVMREAMEVFYDRRFREKLDTNPYLICFNNGVYDLKLNIFRPGRPEDFLSKAMPIDFIDYDEDDDKVQEVHSFLEKVFPDKSVRRYFLDTSCQVFVGGNQQKIALFWTGDGDNAKSITQSIFEQMLGSQLAIKFNTAVITGKKPGAGSTNADLARAGGGVRWAVLEEPDNDEMINVGVLKHYTGNDTFYARDLFERGKDGREITPMFKLVFICNKLPKMKYSDKATWNRVRVVPFESTFCREDDPAPEKYEDQLLQKRFPMDKKFSQKIPGMLSAFAWVLLNHRKKMQDRPIVEPEKVRAATAVYRKQNDIYRQFFEEHIIEDKKKVLSLTELYSQFKEWFRESIPNHQIPPRSDVEEYFTRLWGDAERGKKWSGYRIRTIQDEVDAGDAIILDDEDLVDYDIVESKQSNLPPM